MSPFTYCASSQIKILLSTPLSPTLTVGMLTIDSGVFQALSSLGHQHRSTEVRSRDCSNHKSRSAVGAACAAQTLSWPNPHMCIDPQSLQLLKLDASHLEHLSVQMFHNCSLYQAICRGLIHGLHSCREIYLFFLSCTACGAQPGFKSSLHGAATPQSICLLRQEGVDIGDPLGSHVLTQVGGRRW